MTNSLGMCKIVLRLFDQINSLNFKLKETVEYGVNYKNLFHKSWSKFGLFMNCCLGRRLFVQLNDYEGVTRS